MIYIYCNWLCKLSNLKFVIICTVWDQQGKLLFLIIINVDFKIFFISILLFTKCLSFRGKKNTICRVSWALVWYGI